MESKKHICNKICINTFEDFLKSAIAICILIERYQGYFVRNIFRTASAFRLSFNKNESRFLLYLSDNLHNVPELAELFIETVRMLEDCESEDEITELIKSTKENFLLKLVAKNHIGQKIKIEVSQTYFLRKDGKKHIVRNHLVRPVKVLEVEGEYQEYEEKIQNVERKTEVPIYYFLPYF